MEKELNIAAILKDKPQNTRLWSPIFGDVYLKDVTDVNNNMIRITHHGVDNIFMNNGKVWADGDVCLFPSRCMDDWQKFAWKKGDVLVSNEGDVEVIFDKWYDDTYTNFYGKHYLDSENENNIKYFEGFVCITERYFLESKDAAQTYINTIEERLGGKLNLETLEIEQPKREFKDGDIVTLKIPNLEKNIRIFKEVVNKKMHENHYYVGFNFDDDGRPIQIFKDYYAYTDNDRPATDSEKQQLFSALAKEGKRWNPDTKQIEDLPKKCEFKPMDWCLMRDKKETWKLCQFSFFDDGDYEAPYNAVGGNWFDECIPYNEETKHLLGTTDEWKGGEG